MKLQLLIPRARLAVATGLLSSAGFRRAVLVSLLIIGAFTARHAAAAPNYALDFSTGGYLDVPNPAGVVQSQKITVAAWIWPFQTFPAPGPRTILSRGDGGGVNDEYIFQIGNTAPGDLALYANGWYRTSGGV